MKALRTQMRVSSGFMPAGPQLAATNGTAAYAALRPVHPGGSNVSKRVSGHALPLAQAGRKATQSTYPQNKK